jgi:hypothetical protein
MIKFIHIKALFPSILKYCHKASLLYICNGNTNVGDLYFESFVEDFNLRHEL